MQTAALRRSHPQTRYRSLQAAAWHLVSMLRTMLLLNNLFLYSVYRARLKKPVKFAQSMTRPLHNKGLLKQFDKGRNAHSGHASQRNATVRRRR